MSEPSINSLGFYLFPLLSVWIGLLIGFLITRDLFIIKKPMVVILKDKLPLMVYYIFYLLLASMTSPEKFQSVSYIFIYCFIVLVTIFVLFKILGNLIYGETTMFFQENEFNIPNLLIYSYKLALSSTYIYLYIYVFSFLGIIFYSDNAASIFTENEFWILYAFELITLLLLVVQSIIVIINILKFMYKKLF